jgi:hypothetical protein
MAFVPRRVPVVVVATFAPAVFPLFAACQRGGDAGGGPYARQVAAAVPAIERSVGVPFKSPPRVEARSCDEVRSFLEKKFDEEQPALEMAGQERAYKLFGLLPDTMNLRRFLLALLAEQVAGYYDPATKVLYVVGGGGCGAVQSSPEIVNVTITHELVHALQDQYLPLDSITRTRGANDRQTAAQAVIEGQATFEHLSVMLGGGGLSVRLPGGWDRVREVIRDSRAAMPVFATAPMLIQETLLFPYLSGAEFMRQFKERRPGQTPFRTMPVSTEQVMHPERLLVAEDRPVRVRLPRPANATVVYENDLGEFETRLLLYQQLEDVAAAARGADGWGGDRYYVVNTARGAGLTWLSVWDTPVEAAEFRDALARALEKRFGVALSSAADGTVLRLSAKGRAVEVIATDVQGYAGVLYTDVPAGVGTRLIDARQVRVER